MHLDGVQPPTGANPVPVFVDDALVTIETPAAIVNRPIYWPRYGSFGDALQAMREGKRVARAGWNGKGMSLAIAVGGSAFTTRAFGADKPLLPFIVMQTAQGEFIPWLASQADMLAYDWSVL